LSSDVVIRAEGLGKRYIIGHQAERECYVSLRDTVALSARRMAKAAGDLLRRRAPAAKQPSREEFWALKDVSFDLRRGEVVGIIGPNGAGKSTLLKILSRITEPTIGRVELKGRVASLLEVGTGFHPELTGRENIYLNGAILGMTRAEIRRKFDEIVAFSEIERFLDTPIKRYSSGMYVRLAFAVAAHLEAEILVIDEVLAVGDADFQKKCLGKMANVASSGRTILFVSHNMNAIERLCGSVLILDCGREIGLFESVRKGIDRYLRVGDSPGQRLIWKNDDSIRSTMFVPQRFEVRGSSPTGPDQESFSNQFPIDVFVSGQLLATDPALNIGIGLYDGSNQLLLWSFTTDQPEERWPRLSEGSVQLRVRIPARLLNEGIYRLDLLCSLHRRAWLLETGRNSPSVYFSIRGGLSDSPYWDGRRPGLLAPILAWSLDDTEVAATDQ
jgi:lipopolysaccharide transport system ATP-binding protein